MAIPSPGMPKPIIFPLLQCNERVTICKEFRKRRKASSRNLLTTRFCVVETKVEECLRVSVLAPLTHILTIDVVNGSKPYCTLPSPSITHLLEANGRGALGL